VTEYYHASSSPLTRVLALWDVFLAFGMHLSVIISVSRLVNMREELKKCWSASDLMRLLAANQLPRLEEPNQLLDVCANVNPTCTVRPVRQQRS
jgi:hypothetical protein